MKENKDKMKRILRVMVFLALVLMLLNCIGYRYIQDTYSVGGYPSYHPTHKK